MNNSCQTTYAIQGLPFRGNPKQIVVYSLDRTMASYNEASFNMAKNEMKRYMMQNTYSDYTLPKVTTQI